MSARSFTNSWAASTTFFLENTARSISWQGTHQSAKKSTRTGRPARRASASASSEYGSQAICASGGRNGPVQAPPIIKKSATSFLIKPALRPGNGFKSKNPKYSPPAIKITEATYSGENGTIHSESSSPMAAPKRQAMSLIPKMPHGDFKIFSTRQKLAECGFGIKVKC